MLRGHTQRQTEAPEAEAIKNSRLNVRKGMPATSHTACRCRMVGTERGLQDGVTAIVEMDQSRASGGWRHNRRLDVLAI